MKVASFTRQRLGKYVSISLHLVLKGLMGGMKVASFTRQQLGRCVCLSLHLVLQLDACHECAGLVGDALLVCLHVGLQGLLVPGWVRHEGHERVGAVDVCPVYSADPVELDLQQTNGGVLGDAGNALKCKESYSHVIQVLLKCKESYRHVIQVLRLDPCQDAGVDGVARRVKQRLCDLVPLSVHLGLLIHIHANQVLVDPQQVDDGVVLMHKDVRAPWDLPKHGRNSSDTACQTSINSAAIPSKRADLEHILCPEVPCIVLAKGAHPVHGLGVRLSGLVQHRRHVDRGVGDGGEGVLVSGVNHFIPAALGYDSLQKLHVLQPCSTWLSLAIKIACSSPLCRNWMFYSGGTLQKKSGIHFSSTDLGRQLMVTPRGMPNVL